MFSLKLFDPLTANTEEFERFYNYRLKKAQLDGDKLDKNVQQFKDHLVKFYENSSQNHTIYQLIEGKNIIGTIEHFTINKGRKEELLIIRLKLLHKFEAAFWTQYQLEKHINSWINNVVKAKIEAEGELLVGLLKQAGWRESNVKVDLKVSILDLNMAMIDESILKETPKKNNLKVEILLSPTPNEFKQIAVVFTDLLNDMVRTDMSHVFLQTAKELAEIQKVNDERGNLIHRIILRDQQDNIVGLSINKLSKTNPDILWQFMAGISPKYRNKGLTTWMKAFAYKKLLNEYPSLKTIRTDCYIDNNAIIHINKKMGFEIERTTTDMIFEN